MTLLSRVESVQYHRNGITGLGFHVVCFRYRDGRKLRRMAATVFGYDGEERPIRRYDGALAIAVLDLDHPEEKWRGDTFAKELFYAVERYEKNRAAEMVRLAQNSALVAQEEGA